MQATLMAAVLTLAACGAGSSHTTTFSERGISIETPASWSVTGFSKDVTPRRLVAASYPVQPDEVEGDCGGQHAVLRVPRDGAYVVVIAYDPESVPASDFGDPFPIVSDEALAASRLGNFACFGQSYVFHFLIRGRPVQVHVGMGAGEDARRKREALAVVNSITARP